MSVSSVQATGASAATTASDTNSMMQTLGPDAFLQLLVAFVWLWPICLQHQPKQ